MEAKEGRVSSFYGCYLHRERPFHISTHDIPKHPFGAAGSPAGAPRPRRGVCIVGVWGGAAASTDDAARPRPF